MEANNLANGYHDAGKNNGIIGNSALFSRHTMKLKGETILLKLQYIRSDLFLGVHQTSY